MCSWSKIFYSNSKINKINEKMRIDTRILIGIFILIFIFVLGYSTITNYFEKYSTVSQALDDRTDRMIWVNGTIKKGSFTSLISGEYRFIITDGHSEMNVSFTEELPYSLGMESEIVLLGKMENSTFYATRMIAKCPTKYNG